MKYPKGILSPVSGEMRVLLFPLTNLRLGTQNTQRPELLTMFDNSISLFIIK